MQGEVGGYPYIFHEPWDRILTTPREPPREPPSAPDSPLDPFKLCAKQPHQFPLP